MKKETKDILLQQLLKLISEIYNDDNLRSMPLLTRNEGEEIVIYRLVVKGERDKNTPFYCGSMTTHIVKEYWFNNEVSYAEIIADER